MNKAISDLLDSGSKRTEKALKNAEIDAFHPIFIFKKIAKIRKIIVLNKNKKITINNMSNVFGGAEGIFEYANVKAHETNRFQVVQKSVA